MIEWGASGPSGCPVLLMAVPTSLVALLPTYHQIGLAAAMFAAVGATAARAERWRRICRFDVVPGRVGRPAGPARLVSSWCNVSGGVGGLIGSGLAAVPHPRADPGTGGPTGAGDCRSCSAFPAAGLVVAATIHLGKSMLHEGFRCRTGGSSAAPRKPEHDRAAFLTIAGLCRCWHRSAGIYRGSGW